MKEVKIEDDVNNGKIQVTAIGKHFIPLSNITEAFDLLWRRLVLFLSRYKFPIRERHNMIANIAKVKWMQEVEVEQVLDENLYSENVPSIKLSDMKIAMTNHNGLWAYQLSNYVQTTIQSPIFNDCQLCPIILE